MSTPLMPVPEELQGRAFRSSEAARFGVSRTVLGGPSYRRMLPDIYVPADAPDSLGLRAQAASLAMPGGAALTGAAALWVRGVLVPLHPGAVLEVIVPNDTSMRGRPGLKLWRGDLRDDELTDVGGLTVATPERALLDIARRRPLEEAVVAMDAAAWADLVDLGATWEYFQKRRALSHVIRARFALSFARHGVRSPGETRVRLTIVFAGMHEPWVNVPLLLPSGRTIISDLGYFEPPLGIEHDGREFHDTAEGVARDRRRDNEATTAGLVQLRFDRRDLTGGRERIVRLVRHHLDSWTRQGRTVYGAVGWIHPVGSTIVPPVGMPQSFR